MEGILSSKGIEPTLGKDVYIAPGAWVTGDVVIGDRSSIWFNTVIRGDEHYVRIGADTNVQDNSTLHVTSGKFPLEIGDRVTIGHRAVVHGCVVEDDCLIGIGAIILDGAHIGKGSLIGAGAVVTPGTKIPPGSMVMGIPATVKRELTEEERAMILANAPHYVETAAEYMNPEVPGPAKKVKGFLG